MGLSGAMIRNRGKVVAVLAVLIASFSFGEDEQARGEAMLERARLASDIRAMNAPGFRLKASFSFVSEKLEKVEGTYVEWWVSKSQWRRETVVGDSRRIEIGGVDKRWLLDTGSGLPEQVRRLPRLFDVIPPKSTKFEFDSIVDPAPDNSSVHCAITAPGLEKQKSAFCFHKPSGVLIQKVEPYPVGRRISGYSCDYAGFHMYGNFTYPREMACFIEGHRKIEAKVTELSLEPSPDAALFKAPPEAVELDTCSGKITAPKAISNPDPSLPWRAGSDSSVVLELIVDANGSPQDLRVTRSGGKSFDKNALRAVHAWRFRPALCDGRPIAMTIQVEVDFRLAQ
jgi:TonB family protein